MPNKCSDELIKNIISDYNSGIIITELSLKYNLSKFVISGVLKRNGAIVTRGCKLANQKFGRLTALEVSGKDKFGARMWKCQCVCGNIVHVRTTALKMGHTTSCGCYKKEVNSSTAKKIAKERGGDRKKSLSWKGYQDIPHTYFSTLQYNAKVRKLDFDITIEYLWDLFVKQGRKCALSGVELTFGYNKPSQTASLDRIDSALGYINGNVQWIHKDINFMKGGMHQNKFIDICSRIYKNQSSHNIGFLYNTRVYLGGQIENLSDFIGWREDITNKLEPLSVICLDPTKDMFIRSFREDKAVHEHMKQLQASGKYDELQEIMKRVVSKDLRAIDICDFAIFRIDVDKPTYGTVHEYVNCAADRKPILLWVNDKKRVPMWLLRFVELDNIFDSEESLLKYIYDINSGKAEMNKKLWKILQPEYRTGMFMGKNKDLAVNNNAEPDKDFENRNYIISEEERISLI